MRRRGGSGLACQPHGGSTANPVTSLPSAGQLASLPLGDIAGAAEQLGQTTKNPYENNKEAIAEGHKLFVAMNCAGCHGYDATGGMGPDLTDKYWRYGGTPASVYQSIFEGRPQGMPSWGRALPPQEIWKIVAYVETLGGTFAPTQYHAGLQGDHDVTFVAPEMHDLGPMFDTPRGAVPSQQSGAPGQNCNELGSLAKAAGGSSTTDSNCRGAQ